MLNSTSNGGVVVEIPPQTSPAKKKRPSPEDVAAIIQEEINKKRELLESGFQLDIARDPNTAYGQSTLAFRDLTFSIPTKKTGARIILTPTSGAYEAGSMVALMVRARSDATTTTHPITLFDLELPFLSLSRAGSAERVSRPHGTSQWRTFFSPWFNSFPSRPPTLPPRIFTHRLRVRADAGRRRF
jgi:hypothetical protein